MKLSPLMKKITLALFLMASILSCVPKKSHNDSSKPHHQLLSDFIDLRHGMFICYNIMSYGAAWGEANYPIDSFDPQKLDAEQWAKAANSANMTFGLLTTKHHEGFCLWDSEFTKYDVASTPYKKDIVKQYVDAFRKHNLKVGLYYSIWDSSHGIDKEKIDKEKMNFIKGQITELLTNYGKIDYFVIDGWFWRMGHQEVPYIEIRELIRNLQPECLITDHTHLQAPYHVDIPYFEGPFGAFPESDNTMASALGHCSVKGNGWFWNMDTPNGLKKDENAQRIVAKLKKLENRYCNFMLNCMPNRDGLLDTLYIDLLHEVGNLWSPNTDRKPLPELGKNLIYSFPIKKITATSGKANNLFDAAQYGTDYKHWFADSSFPQEIIIDMGKEYAGIDIVQIIPNHRCKPAPESALKEGNILNCVISVSSDGKKFKTVASKTYLPNSKYKNIDFEPQKARYIKIEILDAVSPWAIIAELNVGSSYAPAKTLN